MKHKMGTNSLTARLARSFVRRKLVINVSVVLKKVGNVKDDVGRVVR